MDRTVNTLASTRSTRSLPDLPSEILSLISIHLCRHDQTVCARVNRTLQEWFMDLIWDTVDIQESGLLTFNGSRNFIPEDYPVIASSALVRNLHRIRVLRLTHAALVQLMPKQEQWSSPGSVKDDVQWISGPQQPLRLQEFVIRFGDWSTGDGTYGDLRGVVEIMDQASTSLQRFTVQLMKNSARWDPVDQSVLLASLPSGLEELNLHYMDSLSYQESRLYLEEEGRDAASFSYMTRVILPRTKGRVLDHLKSLSIIGLKSEMLENLFIPGLLLDRAPSLQELHVGLPSLNHPRDLAFSPTLTRIIAESCRSGWKTIGFTNINSLIDRRITSAVLEHCPTLENLRIPGSLIFDSRTIQQVLCRSPKLRRLDAHVRRLDHAKPLQSHMLLADDILKSQEKWVCRRLESFRCMIGGIPRPDIQTIAGTRVPLVGDLHNPAKFTAQESQQIQRDVLARFAGLGQLKELVLGVQVKVDYNRLSEDYMDDDLDNLTEEEYCQVQGLELNAGHNHQCLTLALQDGLELLEGLKEMKRLQADGMSVSKGDMEDRWVQAHWPEYDEAWRDPFWTKRGYPL